MAVEPSTVQPVADRADSQELIERVQALTAEVDALADPHAREVAGELTSAVVEMYGAGLERIVDHLRQSGAAGEEIACALADDDVVGSLLLIHDLHPVPLEERVGEALQRVRPYMESHGGDVELLGIEGGVARLRLQGSCRTCSASSATLELAVRQALEEAAPDLLGMDVEGALEPEPEGISLPMAAPRPAPSWFALDGVGALAPGRQVGADAGGAALVVANVEGTLLAYRDRCAGCGAPLHDGALAGGELRCPSCGCAFLLTRAGLSCDGADLQLEPVPLLRDNGSVKVALQA